MAKKPKVGKYEHGRDQVSTIFVSTRSILWTKEFGLGAEDAAAGRPYRPEYERWNIDKQWNYERGRIYGLRTKGTIPVKVGKRVNYDALRAYDQIRAMGDLAS
jgi:hypothetical protein